MRIAKLNVFTWIGFVLVAVWCVLALASPETGFEIIPVLLGAAISCFAVGIMYDIANLFKD